MDKPVEPVDRESKIETERNILKRKKK